MPLCSFNWRFQMEISVLEGMASHRFKMIQTVLSIQHGVLGTWDQKPCQTCQGWPTKDVLPNRSLETCGRVRRFNMMQLHSTNTHPVTVFCFGGPSWCLVSVPFGSIWIRSAFLASSLDQAMQSCASCICWMDPIWTSQTCSKAYL